MDAVGDFYSLLGVAPTATQDEIRKAYRAAAGRFHPDVNRSPAASFIFREITTAYETLNDPAIRAEYDREQEDLPAERTLRLSALLSRQIIPSLEEPQLLYVMLTLDPPFDVVVSGGSAPLNLALVIDRSTSMKGPRLDQVKAATSHIIDSLESEDIVSVVSFSDHADVIIPATRPVNPRTMKATVSTMRASGATAMYEGLRGGLREMSKSLHPRYINHLILITDGHTYGDVDKCLQLADQAREQGVSISAMGIGEGWNDSFLDELASRTGGASIYISSHRRVTAFLEERVRSLGTIYAERARLVVAPTPGVKLDSIFRVSPDPMPLGIDPQPIPFGMLDAQTPTSFILQFNITASAKAGPELFVGRVLVRADILGTQRAEMALADVAVQVSENPPQQRPPSKLVSALSSLSLYQLQEQARSALDQGNAIEASRRLELLSTRLLEQGEPALAQAAMAEAQRVAATKVISDEGRKQLKYGTRALVHPGEDRR